MASRRFQCLRMSMYGRPVLAFGWIVPALAGASRADSRPARARRAARLDALVHVLVLIQFERAAYGDGNRRGSFQSRQRGILRPHALVVTDETQTAERTNDGEPLPRFFFSIATFAFHSRCSFPYLRRRWRHQHGELVPRPRLRLGLTDDLRNACAHCCCASAS